MSDSSFTLLELHLGDGDVDVGPFELFGGTDDPAAGIESKPDASGDRASDDAAGSGSDGGCRAKSVAGLLLALAALVAVAVGVAAFRGDDEVPSGIAGDD